MPRPELPPDQAMPLLAEGMCQVETFSRFFVRRPLRAYQLEPARAIVGSVLSQQGRTYAVMMSRQAGKNETAAHVEAMVMNLHRQRGGSIVKAAPTFRPQAINSLQRLESIMARIPLPGPLRERGYMLRLGRSQCLFLSASPSASVVGATASLLLEGDEAQDIDESKWNKDFRPMGASTNATTVLWGTAWTHRTLLARTVRALQRQQRSDGIQRVFKVPWDRVADEVPAYGAYVESEIARLGAHHPLIRSQYYLEEIDDEAGLFLRSTRALMRGNHSRQRAPREGREYALLVDVAGEAEEHAGAESLVETSSRDSTALTIVEIVRNATGMARFLVMDRYIWLGTPHHQIYGAIVHLADLWAAHKVVVDATGIGAGLTSFLKRELGERVEPFVFTQKSKSDLGWDFLGICNSGRFLDYRDDGSDEQRQFWRQVEAADYEVLDGPNRTMRWSVADPQIHDDMLISAALCAALDDDIYRPGLASTIIESVDPLEGRPFRRHRR